MRRKVKNRNITRMKNKKEKKMKVKIRNLTRIIKRIKNESENMKYLQKELKEIVEEFLSPFFELGI